MLLSTTPTKSFVVSLLIPSHLIFRKASAEHLQCQQVLGVQAAIAISLSLADGAPRKRSVEQATWQSPPIILTQCFKGEVAFFFLHMMSMDASICHPVFHTFYSFPFALSFPIFILDELLATLRQSEPRVEFSICLQEYTIGIYSGSR